MEPKMKNLDYTKCESKVVFDQEAKSVSVYKTYYQVDGSHTVSVYEFDLRTMPLSVALQLSCAIVQQVGLVEYE